MLDHLEAGDGTCDLAMAGVEITNAMVARGFTFSFPTHQVHARDGRHGVWEEGGPEMPYNARPPTSHLPTLLPPTHSHRAAIQSWSRHRGAPTTGSSWTPLSGAPGLAWPAWPGRLLHW